MQTVIGLGRIAGAVALAFGVTATSQAATPALEWTASILGEVESLSRTFTIDSLANPFQVTLIDNEFLAAFDQIHVAVLKEGGDKMGSLNGPGSFEFTAPVIGSYVATVVGDPGAFNGLEHSTFGVTVAAVPEPETWAMMLIGVGLVGWQLRRKVKASAASRFV